MENMEKCAVCKGKGKITKLHGTKMFDCFILVDKETKDIFGVWDNEESLKSYLETQSYGFENFDVVKKVFCQKKLCYCMNRRT